MFRRIRKPKEAVILPVNGNSLGSGESTITNLVEPNEANEDSKVPL